MVDLTQLRAAFMAGFMSSYEGWNGEWPFDKENGADDYDRANLEAIFHHWMEHNPPLFEEK